MILFSFINFNGGFMKRFIDIFSQTKRAKFFCLSLLLCNISLHGLVAALPENKNVDLAKQVENALNTDSINAQNLFAAVVDGLDTLKSLDYRTTDQIVFRIMGHEVILDLGFAGSGNIFEPLKPVKPRFNITGTELSLANVAQIVIKNELIKQGRNSKNGILRTLSSFELSPVFLLGLKLMLLVKSLDNKQDVSSFFEEIMSLLFRLSLVDDIQVLDKNKNLTDYLPEIVTQSLEEVGLGVTDSINNIWSLLVCNKHVSSDLIVAKPTVIHGFAFAEEDVANAVYQKALAQKDVNLGNIVDDFAQNRHFEIVKFNDFIEKMNGEELENNQFDNNLIGTKDFYFDKNYIPGSQLEEELIANAKKLSSKEGIIYLQDAESGNYWIAQATSQIGFDNAAKGLIFALTRAFKDYASFKKSLFDDNDEFALKYRRDFAANEALKKLLVKFTKHSDCKQIFENLCQEIYSVTNKANTKNLVNDGIAAKKATLEKEIAELNTSKRSQNAELARLKKMYAGFLSKLYAGNNKEKVNKEIKLIEEAIATIDRQIEEAQAKIAVLKPSEQTALLEDTQRLEKLQAAVDKKRQAGEVVDQKILDAVKNLKAKIAKLGGGSMPAINVDEKLVIRENVAKIFEKYAQQLKNDLNAIDDKLKCILNPEDRAVQEVLLDEVVALKSAFAKQLESEATRVKAGNEKIIRLVAFRKTCKESGITLSAEKAKELSILENEVGHLIDSDNNENFIAKLMGQNSLFEAFINDLSQEHSDKIAAIKQRVLESFQAIFSGSDNLKDNAILYRYFTQFLPAGFKSMLRAIGISELYNA